MYRNYILIIIVFLTGCINRTPSDTSSSDQVLAGEYWRSQALNDIMPYWTKYSRDTVCGAFLTTLDSLWHPSGDQNKYPSMISRHLFSYSAAYVLSGEEEDILIADSTARWLLDHAWDSKYGGWYDALDQEGNPVQTTKSTFVQVYAITGLVMYYFVTHDSTILSYIEKSNELLENRVWDHNAGGYYNLMNRDWSVSSSDKSFSSEITPVSGYLIYLYLASREKKYSDQIDRILRITVNDMIDKETGWVLEDFNTGWKYLPQRQDESEINTGHNIEAAWMLFRNYLITKNEDHLNAGNLLAAKIRQPGLFNNNGIWLSTAGRTDPSQPGKGTYWWIQAYGNMFSLYQYHITKNREYLDNFVKGANFWDDVFIDRKNGDTFFSVDSAGKVTDAKKANQFKTSYHSIEQCVLNYLYLNLWVNNEPVELHFRINSSRAGQILYPVLIEDESIKIDSITGRNEDQKSFIVEGQGVRLPELKNYPLTIFLKKDSNLR